FQPNRSDDRHCFRCEPGGVGGLHPVLVCPTQLRQDSEQEKFLHSTSFPSLQFTRSIPLRASCPNSSMKISSKPMGKTWTRALVESRNAFNSPRSAHWTIAFTTGPARRVRTAPGTANCAGRTSH